MDDKTCYRIKFMVNIAYYVLIGAIAYLVLKYVTNWIMPFILAFIIVSIVHPIILKVSRALRLKHELAAVFIMFLLYGLAGYGVFIVVAKIISALARLFSGLPFYYENTLVPLFAKISNQLAEFGMGIPFSADIRFSDVLSNILNALQGVITRVSQGGISFVTAITNNVPTFIVSFIFMIMLSFFISIQYDRVIIFFKAQLSEKGRKMVSDFKSIFIDTVLKYLQAYVKLMCVTFLELSLGLYFIGVDNPLAVAAGIACFDVLPVLGAGGVLIPWSVIELIQGNITMALGIILLYVTIAFIRNIIEPKIVGDQLGMNPIVSLTSIYFGLQMFGILGMIAMPIIVKIIIAMQRNGNIHLFNDIGPKAKKKSELPE